MECPVCQHKNIDGARFCAKCGAPLPTQMNEGDPLIGSIVGGRYRITGVLGEGGMGRVYTAEQQMGTSVRKVAVKTLLSQYARDPQVVARFMRECGTVVELEHPNTIKIYDFGQTDTGDLYIAMELLNGKSLEETLETNGALSPERVDRIIGQACGSLQEAHDKGIVHRDLKPANIFLTKTAGEEDYVKVLDFGIAKRAESKGTKEQKLTQQGTVLGTPPYMSPEQFTGKELDARSDIYSLGVVVYEMLTGRLPFEADNPMGWATQHMMAQPFPFEALPMGASVPPKMKAAVMRALEKDPNRRQQSVRDFYDEFTLGIPRLSVLGAASGQRPSAAQPSAAGTAMMPSRSGATQIGEPLFASQSLPQAASRTVIDSGPMQQVPANNSAYGMPTAQTGPGTAYPSTGPSPAYPASPPVSGEKKASAAPIIAILAIVGVVGLVGAVVLIKKSSTGEEDKDTIMVPSGLPAVVTSDPLPTVSSASAAVASGSPSASTPIKTGTQGTIGQGQAGTSKTDQAADAACDQATSLGRGGNVSMAVSAYRKCSGPKQSAARAAIDAGAITKVKSQGCRAKAEAQLAASIGASSAMKALPQNCR